MQWKGTEQIGMKDKEIGVKKKLSGDVIELLIYHQPGVKPSLTFFWCTWLCGWSFPNRNRN